MNKIEIEKNIVQLICVSEFLFLQFEAWRKFLHKKVKTGERLRISNIQVKFFSLSRFILK